jgi:hypothetical protein
VFRSQETGEILVFGGRWVDGRREFSGDSNGQRGFRIKSGSTKRR